MKRLTLDLPEGAIQRGGIYSESVHYGLGDVLEVELPNGEIIDIGWDEDQPEAPFRVVVYREYFGNRTVDLRAKTVAEAIATIEGLARALCSPSYLSPITSSTSINFIAHGNVIPFAILSSTADSRRNTNSFQSTY